MSDLARLESEVMRLSARVAQLDAQVHAQADRNKVTEVMPPQSWQPKILPDVPPFFLSRYGAPNFNKVLMAPGVFLEPDGGRVYTTEAEYTITEETYFWAKWDHQDQEWLGTVISGAEVPADSPRFKHIPIAKVTVDSGKIGTVEMYHCGVMIWPALPLPNGIMNYDVLTWDDENWSATLPADFDRGWVVEITRGHEAPPP